MILTSVLLPAPFAPMSACTSPGRTSRLAERRALTAPKVFATPLRCRSDGASLIADSPKERSRQRRRRLRMTSGALARENLIHRVVRPGLHLDRDAVERIELRIIRFFQLGHIVSVVPDRRDDLDEVRVLLAREH